MRSARAGDGDGRDRLSARETETDMAATQRHRPSAPTTLPIGRKTPPIDGPQRVSGMAKYAADFHFPGLLYAVPVEATIANGRVEKIDTSAAERMPGVRGVLHRGNIGKISRSVQ